MDDESLNKLSHILYQQLELQTELLVLEKDKTKILVKGELEKLDQVIIKEQSIIMKSAGLEKQREALLTETGLIDLTMPELIEKHNLGNKYMLNSRLTGLSNVLNQLKKTNDLNNKIILSRLSVLGQCLSLIGLREDSLTYKKDGHF